MRHHAICVTGLQRSYPEISGNVVTSLESLYGGPAAFASNVAIFGVRPENNSWAKVYDTMPPLANETLQRPCGTYPKMHWFSVYHRSASAYVGFLKAFQMSLCDMRICLMDLVEPHELHHGRKFHTLARLRLDLAWEAPLRMPAGGFLPHTVYLPRMNGKAGFDDKFAMGLRRPMGVYLSRVEDFAVANRLYNYSRVNVGPMTSFACGASDDGQGKRTENWLWCRPQVSNNTLWQGSAIAPLKYMHHHPHPLAPESTRWEKSMGGRFQLSSEGFLQWALWRQNVSVMLVQSWMFCKYKDAMIAGNNTPRSCVKRMRVRGKCQSLSCMSSLVDCGCLNNPCGMYDKKKQRNVTSWYCTDVAGDQLDNDGRLF